MKKLLMIYVLFLGVNVCLAQETHDLVVKKRAVCISTDIVFIADYSGSVANSRHYIASAFLALPENFALSPEGIKIGIIKFDTYGLVLTNCTHDDNNLLRCVKYLSEASTGGGTDIMAGLLPAIDLFKISK